MNNTTPYTRLQSIDLLRGAIMILMVIDHVRCYTGLPTGGPEPAIFFTRWITHFCAPVFCFFAGSAAYLHGKQLNDRRKLALFLVTRGLLLVVLELTLVRFCWAFKVDYTRFVFMGILWMLGWCMIIMALMIRLKPLTVGIIGMALIVFQPVVGWTPRLLPVSVRPSFAQCWEFIYPTGQDWPQPFAILYVIVPWIGVMAAGYGFGLLLQMEAARRRRICLQLGLVATALFIVIGSTLLILQPPDEQALPFIFRLLNQQKYPASPLYLLMTLGPIIALIPYAEKASGWLARALCIIGRVPLFYYLLHIPLIHLSAQLVNFIRNGFIAPQWYYTAPFSSVPPQYTWNLGLLYLVVVLDVLLLYLACRWYAGYKQAHPGNQWLKYL